MRSRIRSRTRSLWQLPLVLTCALLLGLLGPLATAVHGAATPGAVAAPVDPVDPQPVPRTVFHIAHPEQVEPYETFAVTVKVEGAKVAQMAAAFGGELFPLVPTADGSGSFAGRLKTPAPLGTRDVHIFAIDGTGALAYESSSLLVGDDPLYGYDPSFPLFELDDSLEVWIPTDDGLFRHVGFHQKTGDYFVLQQTEPHDFDTDLPFASWYAVAQWQGTTGNLAELGFPVPLDTRDPEDDLTTYDLALYTLLGIHPEPLTNAEQLDSVLGLTLADFPADDWDWVFKWGDKTFKVYLDLDVNLGWWDTLRAFWSTFVGRKEKVDLDTWAKGKVKVYVRCPPTVVEFTLCFEGRVAVGEILCDIRDIFDDLL